MMNTTISNSTIGNQSLYIGNCLLVDPDGYPYIDWMYNVMGECVHSPLEQSSFYVGLGSIVLYLFGGIPQIIQNFMKGHADGLAPLTLAQWMVGDGSNLLGAVLTGQLFTQILLAVYFVLVDIVLIGQFVGYKLRDWWRGRKDKKKCKESKDFEDEHHHKLDLDGKKDQKNVSAMKRITSKVMSVFGEKQDDAHDMHIEMVHSDHSDDEHHNEANQTDPNSAKLHSHFNISVLIILIGFLFIMGTLHLNHYQQDFTYQNRMGRKLLAIQEEKDHNSVEFPPNTAKSIIGYVIGCIATVSYLGSRIAQIVKNFKRGSTEGMNPILFLCSVSGNILYSLSIFLFSVDSSFLKWKIPWLCSSLGNITLDTVILSQYIFYTFIKKHLKINKIIKGNQSNKV